MAEHANVPPTDSFGIADDTSADWTVVETFNSEVDAAIARGALEAEGIPAMLTNQTFGNVLPIGFNSIGGVSLWVPTDSADSAILILRRNGDTHHQDTHING